MNAWIGFGRGILFALLAAGLCPLWLGVAAPALGWALAVKAYAIAAASLYLVGIAPRRMTGLAAAAILCACGSALALGGATVHTLGVALAAGIGALRSGLLWPSPRPAACAPRFVAELALIGGGLTLAAQLLQTRAVFPEALALWGFFLAQSAFFLIPSVAAAESRRSGAADDAFEVTTRRLRALLDERS